MFAPLTSHIHISITYIFRFQTFFIIYISSFIFLSNLSFRIFHMSISLTFLFPIFTSIWDAERSYFARVKITYMIFQSLCLILFHADYQLCPRNILVICFQDTFRLTRYDLLLKQSICRSLFTKSGLLFFCNLCFLLKARIPGIKKELLLLIFFLYSDCLFHKQGSGRWIFFLHIKCNPPWEKGHNAKQEHLEQRKKGHL